MSAPDSLRGRIDAIAIGASAGGVDALTELLPALPAGSSVAVFVVLHLPRGQPSLLVDIFRPKCALAVREAEDKEPVAPGTIYFAPPDYHLLVDKGHLLVDQGHLSVDEGHLPVDRGRLKIDKGPRLALSVDDMVHFSRPSIDVLFESAADIYGPRLLGVILTGGNEDGAAGLQAVQRAGGITVVQEPGSAPARLMPESALSRSAADWVLTPPQIAQLFRTLGETGAGFAPLAGGK